MGFFDSKEDKAIDQKHEKELKAQLGAIDTKYSDLENIKDDIARRTAKLAIKEEYGIDHHALKKEEVALAKGMSGIHGSQEKEVGKANKAFTKQEANFDKAHAGTLENITKTEAKALKAFKAKGGTKEEHEAITAKYEGQRTEENKHYSERKEARAEGHTKAIAGIGSKYENQMSELKDKHPHAAAEFDAEEKKKKGAPATQKEATAENAAYAGVDISKAKNFDEVKAQFDAAPKDKAFVEVKSEDGKTVKFIDPTVHKEMEAAKKANPDGKLTEEQQKKLDDNTITHKLDDKGKVTDISFGKDVKAVGIVDGNVLEIKNGKGEIKSDLSRADAKAIPIHQAEATDKAAGKPVEAGKDAAVKKQAVGGNRHNTAEEAIAASANRGDISQEEAAQLKHAFAKPAGHQQANPLDMENGSVAEPTAVVAAVKSGHVTQEKGKAMMEALQRDKQEANVADVPAQGGAKSKPQVTQDDGVPMKLPTKPPASLGEAGGSGHVPSAKPAATKEAQR